MDSQLSVQSMPITTKVVSSNPAHGEVYSIQLYYYMIKFVSDLPTKVKIITVIKYTVKPVLRGHLWDKDKMTL
jgi:hypothetical protein